MKILDMAAFRKAWMERKGNTGAGWDPWYMGSQIQYNGKTVQGFYQHVNGSLMDEDGVEQAIRADLSPKLQNAQDDQAIYEILQNAADSKATVSAIFYDDDMLVALNNGIPFTEADIKGVLNSFQGTKSNKDDPSNCDKIGRYGIGFKLIHRLVGRQEGLNELINELRGPVLFSWNKRQDLDELLSGDLSLKSSDDGARLFKILLTCFPAIPGEHVKGLDMKEVVPFKVNELEEIQNFLRSNTERLAGLDLSQGSLFFLRLGAEKRKLLDKTMDAIIDGLAYSMHFLQNLRTIVIQDRHVNKAEVSLVEHRIDPEEDLFKGIDPEFSACPVQTVFGYLPNGDTGLKDLPNVLQFFPMSNEQHRLAYFVHSSGFRKVTDRTKLDKASEGNRMILGALAGRICGHMTDLMDKGGEDYLHLFKAILLSEHKPSKDNEHVVGPLDNPLLEFIAEKIPTEDGHYLPAGSVRLKATKLDIPLETWGLGVSWCHPSLNEDSISASLVKELRVKKWSLADVLKAGGLDPSALASWLHERSEDEYVGFMLELFAIRDVMQTTWFWKLPLMRTEGGCQSLDELCSIEKPFDRTVLNRLYELQDRVSGLPERDTLEKAMVERMKLKECDLDAGASHLYGLGHNAARELMGSVRSILLHLEDEDGAVRFFKRFEELEANNSIAKKIQFLLGDARMDHQQLRLGSEIVIELEGYRKVRIPWSGLFPNSDAAKLEPIKRRLWEIVERSGMDSELEDMFRSRPQDELTPSEVLDEGWKQRFPRWGIDGAPYILKNPISLAFVLAYAVSKKNRALLNHALVQSRTDEFFPLNGEWVIDAPDFIDPAYVLSDVYKGVLKMIYPSRGVEYTIAGESDFELLSKIGIDKAGLRVHMFKESLDESSAVELMDWLFDQWKEGPSLLKGYNWDEDFGFTKAVGFSPSEKVLADKELVLETEKLPAWCSKWASSKAKREFLGALGVALEDDAMCMGRLALLTGEGLADIKWSDQSVAQCRRTLEWLVARGGTSLACTKEHEIAVVRCAEQADEELGLELTGDLDGECDECDAPEYDSFKHETGWEIWMYPGPIPMQYTYNDAPVALMHDVPGWEHPSENVVIVQNGQDLAVALHYIAGKYPEHGGEFDKELYGAFIKAKKAHGAAGKNAKPQSRAEGLARRMAQLQPGTVQWLLLALTWEAEAKETDHAGYNIRFDRLHQLSNGDIELLDPNRDELPFEFMWSLAAGLTEYEVVLSRGSGPPKIIKVDLTDASETSLKVRPRSKISLSLKVAVKLRGRDGLIGAFMSAWEGIVKEDGLDPAANLVNLLSDRVEDGAIHCVFGPPGTGKTYTIARRVADLMREQAGLRVLALAPTNNACDQLLRELEKATADHKATCLVRHDGSADWSEVTGHDRPAEESRVVVSTIHRYVLTSPIDIRTLDWDVLVLDEASMISLTMAMLPIMDILRKEGDDPAPGLKVLFAGDPFQLMPVGVTPSLKDRIDTEGITGFTTENLFTLLGIDSFDLDEAPNLAACTVERLFDNRRSLPPIVSLFGRFRYDDQVNALRESRKAGSGLSFCGRPLSELNVWRFPVRLPSTTLLAQEGANLDLILHYGQSGGYHLRSALLASFAAAQLAKDNSDASIAILCPYTRQVAVCRSLLDGFNRGSGRPISISTVHRYQGSEVDIVLLLLNPAKRGDGDKTGLYVGNIAHFNDPNLINVGISRAKNALIVVAPNSEDLGRGPYFGYTFQDDVLNPENVEDLKIREQAITSLEKLVMGGPAEEVAHVHLIKGMQTLFTKKSDERRVVPYEFFVNEANLITFVHDDLIGRG